MPFYVNPEQQQREKAAFARNGIARGRSVVMLTYADGALLVADNPSATLSKTSEIYDRIAFAAVGKYSEFEQLRVAGIRIADVKGYQYAREDVTGISLANAYANALGGAFTDSQKPFEVELLVVELHDDRVDTFHILYDGSITDERDHVAIGGQAEAISARLGETFRAGLDRDAAIALAARALVGPDEALPEAARLEVTGLDRTRGRRTFFRLSDEQVTTALAAAAGQPAADAGS